MATKITVVDAVCVLGCVVCSVSVFLRLCFVVNYL